MTKRSSTKKSTKKSTKQTSAKGERKIHKVMEENKEGKLKSGSGKKVANRKQAIAIALNEARKSGAKVPPKKGASKKASSKKASSKKASKKASKKRS